MLKIHINVRRFVALLRDEALKKQLALGRVHLRDGQAIAHGRIGRGASTLAQNALAASEGDDVVDRQKKVLVA